MRPVPADQDLTLQEIFALVHKDLARVEIALHEMVKSASPIVEEINSYVHNSGGKRLRPTLALLCCNMFGYNGSPAIRLGVILELIHVATLVHDDIIDNSTLRRGKPSVNSKWGNEITVLMGDWLYMTSFKMALELPIDRVLEILIDITRKMVEGELMQLEQNNRLDLKPEDQLNIALRKTASLFAGCAQLAAILSHRDEATEQALWNYGRSFGLAFQLIDDLLDYTSTQNEMGKPVLKDLEEGKVTLPIIYVMERADGADRDFLRHVVEQRDFADENKIRIINMVQAYGALDDLRREAREHADDALHCLQDLPVNEFRSALLTLPKFVLERTK